MKVNFDKRLAELMQLPERYETLASFFNSIRNLLMIAKEISDREVSDLISEIQKFIRCTSYRFIP